MAILLKTFVQKLGKFVPMQLKARRCSRDNRDEVSKGNPVVLKTESKKLGKCNSKRCEHYIGKGWKDLNHTESECISKK